ncbi:type II secretion system protein [Marinomonas agarivorans]|nr:type II secretion system protein [Marinomonas agarivorans]
MDFQIHPQRGYLLIELLVSLAIGVIILQLVLPVLTQGRQQAQRHLQQMDRVALKAAIVDHFQAQLAPIFWRACRTILPTDEEDALPFSIPHLHIGQASSTNLPNKLATKILLPQTDWLLATAINDCRYSALISEIPVGLPYTCSWRRGDKVMFDNCHHQIEGEVINTDKYHTRLWFQSAGLLGQSGVISQQEKYVWYLAQGKAEQFSGAFWRMPQEKGNALELWAGVEKLAFYPLLDRNTDGRIDTISVNYGGFPLQQVKGLWLEIIANDVNCEPIATKSQLNEYATYRGAIWQYDPVCAVPMQFVVGP